MTPRASNARPQGNKNAFFAANSNSSVHNHGLEHVQLKVAVAHCDTHHLQRKKTICISTYCKVRVRVCVCALVRGECVGNKML